MYTPLKTLKNPDSYVIAYAYEDYLGKLNTFYGHVLFRNVIALKKTKYVLRSRTFPGWDCTKKT